VVGVGEEAAWMPGGEFGSEVVAAGRDEDQCLQVLMFVELVGPEPLAFPEADLDSRRESPGGFPARLLRIEPDFRPASGRAALARAAR